MIEYSFAPCSKRVMLLGSRMDEMANVYIKQQDLIDQNYKHF